MTYPVVKIPSAIVEAKSAMPPLPAKPVFPPRPEENLPLSPKLVKTSPPTKPQSPTPPQRIRFYLYVIEGLASALFSALLGQPIIFILLILLLYWIQLGLDITSYSYRLRQWREEVDKITANYEKNWQQWLRKRAIEERQQQLDLQQHEQDVIIRRQEYQRELIEYQNEVERLEENYKILLATANSPGFITNYQQKCVLGKLANTRTYSGIYVVDEYNRDIRGYAEFPNNCSFSNRLNSYFFQNVHIFRMLDNCIPDFAYICQKTNLHIDIEIDEPYTPRQYPNCSGNLILTHCVGQDDWRDSKFLESGWCIIRFSEKQVICYPDQCCKAIAQLIYDLTGDDSVIQQFSYVNDLTPSPAWTEKEAEIMANRQQRLRYLGR